MFRAVLLVVLLVLAAAVGWFGWRWHSEHVACERRGAAFDARLKRLEEEAKQRIVPGSKKQEVVGFLEKNGLHVSFRTDLNPEQIVGTTSDVGCPHIFGCGDEVLIGVEVNVDGEGTAISRPKVETMYTNCM